MDPTTKIAAPGVYTNVPFGEYRALDAWGSSSLKAMRRGPPARVIWEQQHQKDDTEATRIGSAVHCALLTPDIYDRIYAHKPEGMSFSRKDGMAWRDAHADKVILSFDESVQVTGILAALVSKRAVKESLENATHREVTLVWEQDGAPCKGRPDWIEGRYVFDLKVSRHAEGKALAYRSYVEGWQHQLAHYRTGALLNGLDVKGGRLVVVTPKPPHYVFTLEPKINSLDMLEIENLATVKAMSECAAAGVWPGTEDRWIPVEPPPSALVEFGEQTFDIEEDKEAF